MTRYADRHELKAHRRKRSPAPIFVARENALAAQAPIPDTRRISFVFSDGSVDRMGDTIDPKGWVLDRYKANPVCVFGHITDRPDYVIGRATRVEVIGGALVGDIEFATHPTAEMVFQMVKSGILGATSVGFQALAFDYTDDAARPGGIDITKSELLEISIVPVPANAGALATARSKGIDTAPLARWANEQLESGKVISMRKTIEQIARDARPTGRQPGRYTSKTRAEALKMLEEEIAADAVRQRIETIAPSATPFGFGEKAPAVGKGLNVGRLVAGLLMAKRKGNAAGLGFVERIWGPGPVVHALERALNTTGVATGGALIPQAFAAEIIGLLRGQTVVRRARPRTMAMPGGNLTMPRMIGGAVAAYQGELDDIASSQETFDDLQLNAKKLTALVPVANDLLRRVPGDLDAIIRDDLVQTLARREDIGFLTGDGSGDSTIGFLNRCPPTQRFLVNPFTAYDNGTLVSEAVGTLLSLQLAMRNNMSPMVRPTWISTPGTFAFLKGLRDELGCFLLKQEMAGGKLLGYPYFETQQLPGNLNVMIGGMMQTACSYLFLIDMNEVIIADALALQIDTSDAASYMDGSGNTVSAFTRDQTVYRAQTQHDMQLRHAASILVATLPSWLPPGFNATTGGSPFFVQAASMDGSAAASTWGAPPSGSNSPGNRAANVPGGLLPGRA